MTTKNNIISYWQIFLIAFLMGNALFVGMGNTIIVQISKQNTWLTALIGAILGLIPILMLTYILNYKPESNIIAKVNNLFKAFPAKIINFLLFIIVFAVLILTSWGLSNFAETKYLTETPILFLGLLFAFPTIYACIKGIETIARTIEILFYISIIIHIIITFSLLQFVDVENIKPILEDGFKSIILGVFNFVTYCFTPFITILMIPRKKIMGTKKTGFYLVLGYLIASLIMAHVFFMCMGIGGVHIITLYRYPEYYIIKKATIGIAFDNVENFLSTHWLFNLFSANMMGLYYVKEYIVDLFKIKNELFKNITIIITGLIATYLSVTVFVSISEANNFMQNIFPKTFGLILILIITLLCIKIFIKKQKKKKTTHS